MSDRLVKVASFVNVSQAELAQNRLASEGIPARLGNATLVSWVWYYSYAVGGVTLHVLEGNAERALEILLPTRPEAVEERPPWTCAVCGQQVEGRWEICWNCTASADGTPAPSGAPQDVPPDLTTNGGGAAWFDLITFAALALVFELIVEGRMLTAVVAWLAFAAAVAWCRGVRDGDGERATPDAGHGEEPAPAADPAWESRERRRRMGEAIALRAWRASVFGLLSFPPLLLYSFWLLCRLDVRKTPVGWQGNCRFLAAWIVSVTGLLLFGGLLRAWLAGSLYYELLLYFDILHDPWTWR